MGSSTSGGGRGVDHRAARLTHPTHPLDTIVALQHALGRLAAAEERLAGIPDWMRELHAEHSARKAEIEALSAVAAEAASERRTAELEIGTAQERLKHYQQQISLVRTQREYGALLHEIDTAKVQIKGFEDQAFQAMERHEQAQKQAAAEQERFAELDARYAAELAKWEAEKPSVMELAERERAAVEELRRSVPLPLLHRFERLRERHRGAALAPIRRLVRGGRGPEIFSCGACNYRVRPQVVVEIRNQGTLIECDSCKRILYLASDV